MTGQIVLVTGAAADGGGKVRGVAAIAILQG